MNSGAETIRATAIPTELLSDIPILEILPGTRAGHTFLFKLSVGNILQL